jgi:hypothetical protein
MSSPNDGGNGGVGGNGANGRRSFVMRFPKIAVTAGGLALFLVGNFTSAIHDRISQAEKGGTSLARMNFMERSVDELAAYRLVHEEKSASQWMEIKMQLQRIEDRQRVAEDTVQKLIRELDGRGKGRANQ